MVHGHLLGDVLPLLPDNSGDLDFVVKAVSGGGIGYGPTWAYDVPGVLPEPPDGGDTAPLIDNDADDDGAADWVDDDDDNDGYLDLWEEILETDGLDPNDTPTDTDADGQPDGDSTNSYYWMDRDDDNDGVYDTYDSAPLDPEVTGHEHDNDPTFYDYAIYIMMIFAMIIPFFIMFIGKIIR